MIAPPTDTDMGIWEENGDRSWFPVQFYPTRQSVHEKLREFDNSHSPDEVVIRIAFMREVPHAPEDSQYRVCSRKHRNAFKCWGVETR